ncbi:glycogen debranching protein GlgX [Burkholderiaceae bacterium UC74_6]
MHLPEHILQGRHEPLGAHARDGGINFAVWSENATRIELCIFDAAGQREITRYALHGPHDGVFHGFLPGLAPGLVYGLRADGPYAPQQGHRFNAKKLLLDPYAREIVGHFTWRAEHHGYEIGHPDGPRSFDHRDNSVHALKARVAPAAPPLEASPRTSAPRHACADLVMYEVHVKGFSMLHAEVPAELRGTYAGIAHPAAIAHFKSLGVTTLSLLPVQYAISEPHLADKGLPNYWGYNTLGFFAPDPRLAQAVHRDDPTRVTEEFRAMVRDLHAAGIEVVLDVVYNHTPEGNEFGPSISFRGLDNRSWYRLQSDDPTRNENLTGCGNTLHCAHPRVTQFVLDSLRYWVQEMGVDGFRFDLAPVLGRTDRGFDPHAAFFTAMRQDPILSGVHLIAEPWDAAYDGYQLGRFPGRFMEWNDKFRDAVRGYWLGKGVSRGELARRFLASSDVFRHGQRSPQASINFVSVHDGWVLADVVAYEQKHNHANGEDNRDGRDNELSCNFGAEGPTADAGVLEARARTRRAMLATLLLAQGTPMLCAGDEIANSQQGNNNAYCQDNATSWLSWPEADESTLALTRQLLALRREEPLLRQAEWLTDAGIAWITPQGHAMQAHDWNANGSLAFGARLGDQLMLIFNPEPHDVAFQLPQGRWRLAIDSSAQLPLGTLTSHFHAPARSLLALRQEVV